MQYPQDFPERFKPPVDKAIAEAEIAFASTHGKRPPMSLTMTPYNISLYLRRFVDHVYFEFGRQVCAVVKQGIWSGEKARARMNDFLHTIAVDVFFNKTNSRNLPFETFEERLKREIQESPEWTAFQRGLVDALTPPLIRAPNLESPQLRVSLGAQIRALREEARMTIEELAEDTKISARNIRRHEHGETTAIRPSNLQAYEQAFSRRLRRKITLMSGPRPLVDLTSS